MRILDVFCGLGGASGGYKQACDELGIVCEIVGVDNQPQPHYPFTFIQGDAIIFLYKYGHLFDFIHASPPCQAFSVSTALAKSRGTLYPNLIPATRYFLENIGKPAIMENVTSAPIRKDIVLRGDQFGLKVIRKRAFESVNCFLLQPGNPGPVRGTVLGGDFISVFGNGGYTSSSAFPKGWRPKFDQGNSLDTWRYAMGIPYGDYCGLAEAIPPAYTKFIGTNLFPQLKQL